MESDANKTQNAQKRSVSVAASIDLTSNITDTLKSLSEEKVSVMEKNSLIDKTEASLLTCDMHPNLNSTSNDESKANVPKRKSNSPSDGMLINMKKSNILVNQHAIQSNISACKSSNSQQSTNCNNSSIATSDRIQTHQIQDKSSHSLTCERKITPCRQALRHAVHNLYRVDDFHMEKIGAGFFSEVFKVTHKINQKEMVLKLNKHRSNRTNMLKEIQLMKSFDNPNILRLEAACVHEGQLHALTEYASGGNLEQIIEQKDQALPWSVRMSLALDVAKGLTYLHSKGWFHRDLTSKNILVRISDEEHSKGKMSCANIKQSAVIGDFGLATKIPTRSIGKEFRRLQQVGSPYWMSPECLKGEFYDEKADLFSFGIILCELIGRTGADPDVLPRTSNFGVDYIAFSAICPDCPPDFIQLSFNCVRIDPCSRPSAQELILPLETLLDTQRRQEKRKCLFPDRPSVPYMDSKIILKKVGHRRTVSDLSFPFDEKKIENNTVAPHETSTQCSYQLQENKVARNNNSKPNVRQKFSSPSEKARFHFHSVMSVGKEMSEKDPHYKPCQDVQEKNPFLALPLFQSGQKIFESEDKLPDIKSVEQFLFSSCFELTPKSSDESKTNSEQESDKLSKQNRGAYPERNSYQGKDLCLIEKRLSLPNGNEEIYSRLENKHTSQSEEAHRNHLLNNNRHYLDKDSNSIIPEQTSVADHKKRSITSDNINRYFEDQMFQGRVQLLRRLYGGGCWVTQDDSAIELSSFSSSSSASSTAANIFNLSPETISCLKRRGSCESGFFSSGYGRNGSGISSHYARTISSNASGGCTMDDWCSVGMMSSSARSIGSSLLTVSDLEEDLRAASIFLSSKRTSSVFTDDSIDDVSLADFETWDQRFVRSTSTPQGSNANIMEVSASMSRYTNYGHGSANTVPTQENRCYEKDIRDIVNYFNSITLNPDANSCNRLTHGSNRNSRQRELNIMSGRKCSNSSSTNRSQNNGASSNLPPENNQPGAIRSMYSQKSVLPRSHKIESLIKRVAEKESKQRYRKTFGAPTPLSASMFQQHQQRLQVCDGIVRSKLQLFDHTKRPQRSRLLDQKPGHVKAKLAIFDGKITSNSNNIGHSNTIDYLKIGRTENRSQHQLIEKKMNPMEKNSSDSTETLNA